MNNPTHPKLKTCSQCNKKLNLSDFYKQGDRYESHCKSCKRKKRQKRNKERSQAPPKEAMVSKDKPWNYPAYGLTQVEFLEIKELFEIFLEFKLRSQSDKENNHAS